MDTLPDPEQPATSDASIRPDQAVPGATAEGSHDLKTILRRIGPAGPLALLAVTLPAIGGFLLLGTLPLVGPWLKGLGMGGVVAYSVAFALLSGLAILPTYAQAVLGGWAFAFLVGFPAALIGFGGGAIVGYVIALRATGDRVVCLIEEQRKWRAVYDALLRSGFWRTLLIVTLVRIPLNSPFAITNLVMAATRVPWPAYVVGTLVGMAPRTAAAVWIGAGLKELIFENSAKRWFWAASIVVTVFAAIIIGFIANRAVVRVTRETEGAPN